MTRIALESIVHGVLPHVVALRHELHEYPELMYQEHATAALVRRELDAMDVPYRAGLAGGTGIVAHLPATGGHAEASAPDVVALRADMDALPIHEATGRTWTSRNDGVMHACGHDGHTAILLGAARVLAALPDRIRPVTFVFQPAEEGGAGGQRMVEDGALAGETGGGIGPPASRIYGLHGWPSMPVGHVGTRPGPLLAACRQFQIRVRGQGGHAALPEKTRDPLLAAAHVVTALQTVVARNVDPLDAAVVTVASMHAGTAHNIIAAEAQLGGTIRALRNEVGERLVERIETIAQDVAAGLGCTATVTWEQGFPVTRNDAELAERVLKIARGAFGEQRTSVVARPTMGAEDFAFYGDAVPACFYFLGLEPKDGVSPQLHQPDFDFNDDALATGVELMVRLALEG